MAAPPRRSASPEDAQQALAARAAILLAVDPFGLCGAVLRGAGGSARDAWLDLFRAAMGPRILTLAEEEGDRRRRGRGRPPGAMAQNDTRPPRVDSEALPPPPPRSARSLSAHGGGEDLSWRRMPPGVAEGRLIGGLDLAATLAVGRPVAERGLLAEASGGVLVVPMAERLDGACAGHLAAALDTGEVIVERDGLATRAAARFAAILLDEGEGDEHAPPALLERLAFRLDLGGRPAAAEPPDVSAIAAARDRLAAVAVPDDVVAALCAAGLAFGVPSLRVATLALRTAKAAAALAGRDSVAAEDTELAAALVFAPRATTLPAVDSEPDEHPPDEAPDPPEDPQDDTEPGQEPKPLADSVVEATRAAIPAALLAELSLAAGFARRPSSGGRAGAPRQSARRGRPVGVRRGAPGHGVRLAIVETLRAAAPWQRLRRQTAPDAAAGRILVRREDFRVGRFKEKTETVTIFVVDASGSAALNRLAEVKGAVELILAECYVRRDQVALIAFRGAGADLILPPTRSLARAKRALAGQAGGGGTPLAAAVDAAALLADGVRRKGQTPLVVVMTDGKANVGRSGRPGRPEAEADAMAAAQAFRLGTISSLVLDISPRPADPARRLAVAMGARYIPLPYADAQAVSRAVMTAGPAG